MMWRCYGCGSDLAKATLWGFRSNSNMMIFARRGSQVDRRSRLTRFCNSAISAETARRLHANLRCVRMGPLGRCLHTPKRRPSGVMTPNVESRWAKKTLERRKNGKPLSRLSRARVLAKRCYGADGGASMHRMTALSKGKGHHPSGLIQKRLVSYKDANTEIRRCGDHGVPLKGRGVVER